jgi:hypothetical protein
MLSDISLSCIFGLFFKFVIFSSGFLWCSMTTTVHIFVCICLVLTFHPYISVLSMINILHIQESRFGICESSRLAKAWYGSSVGQYTIVTFLFST